MGSKIKNILIFVVIAAVLVFVYFYFFKKSPETPALVSTTGTLNTTTTSVSDTQDKTSAISKDFLTVLLNVRNIKIDDAIFADPVFLSLRDSTIELVSDGNEGRPNPFAPLGVDNVPVVAAPVVANSLIPTDSTVSSSTTSTTSVTPTMPTIPAASNSSTTTTPPATTTPATTGSVN